MHYQTTLELLTHIKQDIEKRYVVSDNKLEKAYLDSVMGDLASAVYHLSIAEEFKNGTWNSKKYHQ